MFILTIAGVAVASEGKKFGGVQPPNSNSKDEVALLATGSGAAWSCMWMLCGATLRRSCVCEIAFEVKTRLKSKQEL